jgi:integrase
MEEVNVEQELDDSVFDYSGQIGEVDEDASRRVNKQMKKEHEELVKRGEAIQEALDLGEPLPHGYVTEGQLLAQIARKLGVGVESVLDHKPTLEIIVAWEEANKNKWSVKTKRQYGYQSRKFARAFETLPTEPEPVRAYVDEIESPQMQKNVYRILNALYVYASSHYAIPNVMKDIKCPQVDDEDTAIPLKLTEAKAFFDACETLNEKGLAGLYLGQGFRQNEALSLDVEHVLDGILMVKRKGREKKKRLPTPLHSKLAPVIHELCKGKSEGEPLFMSQRKKRLSAEQTNNIIRKLYIKAGIGEPRIAHRLRHSFRSLLCDYGCRREIAELLMAHKVGSKVERTYNTPSIEALRRELEEFSPLTLVDKDYRDSKIFQGTRFSFMW